MIGAQNVGLPNWVSGIIPVNLTLAMDHSSSLNLEQRGPDESRDGDLYFEDGSVVLSTKGDEGGLVYFKVHKSVLTKRSAVFEDMFSLPSPPEVPQYDSLPLVQVYDDCQELKQFLQLIYDPR